MAEMVVTETLHLVGLLRSRLVACGLMEAALRRLFGTVRYKAEKLEGPRFLPVERALRVPRGGARRPRARRGVVDLPVLRDGSGPRRQRRGRPTLIRAGSGERRSRPETLRD